MASLRHRRRIGSPAYVTVASPLLKVDVLLPLRILKVLTHLVALAALLVILGLLLPLLAVPMIVA